MNLLMFILPAIAVVLLSLPLVKVFKGILHQDGQHAPY